MQKLAKALCLLSLSLLVGGCATAPTSLPAEAAARLKRIGVISMTAGVFTRQYTGLTVFGNEREEKNIADWSVDQKYEEQIAAELERVLGVAAVKAPYSQAEFRGPDWGALEGPVKAYCAGNGLDAVLFVRGSRMGDPGSNQWFGGAGIYVRGSPGNYLAVLHLVSEVALLDCATARPLVVRPLERSRRDVPAPTPQSASTLGRLLSAADRVITLGGNGLSAPTIPLEREVARLPLGQWTDDVQRKMLADLTSLPTQSWGEVLQGMFSVGK